jgi:uncharacterized protein YbgA (DUF1722 family)
MTTSFDLPLERPSTPHDLVRFHARHKLLLMAHAPTAVSALGRLVARAGTGDLARTWDEYEAGFRSTVSTPPSRGGHVNALLHAIGYFRGVVDDVRRQQLIRAIELYAAGASSLAAPVRLIRQMAGEHGIGYLIDQVYLQMPGAFDEP